MSANMVPEDDRNFWQRIADAEYGQFEGRGEDTNTFLGGSSGWRPSAGSQFDRTNEVGYFRFNTGNPTRDAIFSLAANELGVDNFVRAVNNLDQGNYWGAAKETVLSAASLLTFGALPLVGVLSKGHRAYKIAQATRAANVPGVGVARAGPSVFTSALSPTARATGQFGYSTPINITQTAPPSLATRLGRAVGANRLPPVPPAAANAGVLSRAARLARVGGRRFLGPLALLGTPAWLYGSSRGDAAPTAEEARAAAGVAEEPEGDAESAPFVPLDDSVSSQTNAATNQARIDIAGINRQYDNILRELKSSYQLSETDEERERLRFMLADIEAQRDAGLQAVSDGYAQTVSQIQEQARISGERTAERSQRYGQELEASADRAAQRMMLQNTQQQEQFRGLGSGSDAPVNEWVGLMSAMSPAQQQYTQRMGDISREGMEWLAQTVGAQGQAQSADLQRLAAATRSGAIARQQAEVSERINRERELQRAAILQTMQQRAGALQSANQFNAGSSGQMLTPGERADTIRQLTSGGYDVPFVRRYFESGQYGGLSPSELDLAERGRSAYTLNPNP